MHVAACYDKMILVKLSNKALGSQVPTGNNTLMINTRDGLYAASSYKINP